MHNSHKPLSSSDRRESLQRQSVKPRPTDKGPLEPAGHLGGSPGGVPWEPARRSSRSPHSPAALRTFGTRGNAHADGSEEFTLPDEGTISSPLPTPAQGQSRREGPAPSLQTTVWACGKHCFSLFRGEPPWSPRGPHASPTPLGWISLFSAHELKPSVHLPRLFSKSDARKDSGSASEGTHVGWEAEGLATALRQPEGVELGAGLSSTVGWTGCKTDWSERPHRT